MDWTMAWAITATIFWCVELLVHHVPGWLQVLRRRLRSEPRPRFLGAQEIAELEAEEQERRWQAVQAQSPQPPSQQPGTTTSFEATGTPEETQHGS